MFSLTWRTHYNVHGWLVGWVPWWGLYISIEFSFACSLSSTHWFVYYLKFIQVKQKPNKLKKKTPILLYLFFPECFHYCCISFLVWSLNLPWKGKIHIQLCLLFNQQTQLIGKFFFFQRFSKLNTFFYYTTSNQTIFKLLWKLLNNGANEFILTLLSHFHQKHCGFFGETCSSNAN